MKDERVKRFKGLVIIIVAAALLEIISGIQYYSMHDMMGKQLEKRAESELTLKAIIIKNMLNQTENALEDYVWQLRYRLNQPDSIVQVVKSLLITNPELANCWVAFTPNYYPQKTPLFEPYARRHGEKIILGVMDGIDHDYTTMEHYEKVIDNDNYHWTNPYWDETLVTTCSKAIRDGKGNFICAFGADLSLDWLGDTLNVRHMFPSSFLLLLTEDGKTIISGSPQQGNAAIGNKIANLINDSSVVRQYSNSGRTKTIRFTGDEMGGDGCVFYANMRGKPHWQIGVVCYDREVYENLYALRLRFLLLNVLAFGVLLFMIARFAHGQRKLQKATLEKTLVNNELRIANNIQTAMLPDTSAPNDYFEVSGKLTTAKEVGGDLYEYFVRNEKLFFCIGDVSGKGIPSALIMAMTQAIFRVISIRENNPARIMEDINVMACQNNKANMFATLFIGVLDLPTGHLRYCNAGHDRPLMVDGEVKSLNVLANLPVGVFTDTKYVMQEVHLHPGTLLFLYTDGLTEAINARREQFGVGRVMDFLKEIPGNINPKTLLDQLTDVVQEYIDGNGQRDDLTLFAIRYKGEQLDTYLLDETLVITNDVQQLRQLKDFIVSCMGKVNAAPTLTAQLRLAVEETVVNIINYAYPNQTKGNISVNIKYDGKSIKMVITDRGMVFDPTQAPQADTSLSAKERPIGGLGILLVRELMDTVNYERIDDRNVLTLKKKIEVKSINNKTDENKH